MNIIEKAKESFGVGSLNSFSAKDFAEKAGMDRKIAAMNLTRLRNFGTIGGMRYFYVFDDQDSDVFIIQEWGNSCQKIDLPQKHKTRISAAKKRSKLEKQLMNSTDPKRPVAYSIKRIRK